MSVAEGGCLCRGVRYAVRAQPHTVWMCHCRMCQRSTGGAYIVLPTFDKVDFSVISGNARTYEHRSEGSGKWLYLHFCDACGTNLFITWERFPDAAGVHAGTFDDPNWFERTPENSKQIFLGVAQHGTIIPAGMETYEEHAITVDGIPIEPTVFDEPKTIGPST